MRSAARAVMPASRTVTRGLLLAVSVLTALVVAALPGTTSASSDPTPRISITGPRAAETAPILIPVSLRSLVRVGPSGPDERLDELAAPRPHRTITPPSVLADTTVISVYGHPGVCVMGELGCYGGPEGAIAAVRSLVDEYEALGTDHTFLPALHLIVDVAQANPGDDGEYLDQMPLDEISEWVEAARDADLLIFLDIQIGWGDLDEHVRRLEPFLEEPFVQLAIDPEFATRSRGERPGVVIGTLTAEQVNAVQEYLAALVRRTEQPAKILVLHQFNVDMLTRPEGFDDVPEVEITVDMDGWGGPWPKISGYEAYALASYSEHPAIKLFKRWDEPLLTPAEVMALSTPPSYITYQ